MTPLVESCGSQVPNLAFYPPGDDIDYALADGVLDWLDALELTLFDWQRRVLRRALGRRGPKWAAYEVDLVVPRQNGKNEILIALELAAANLLGVRLTIHSAHEAITAAKHFARFQELVNEDSPAFKPEVAKLFPTTKTQGFYTSNGKEHIEFANGALIEFRTRTKSAGRGFSAPLVVLDEAFDLPTKAVGALQYTMRAKPNAQFWKTSSAPHADSVVLHNDRRRAKAADVDNSRFLYMEWGNEADVDPSDPDAWLRSNPSIGCEAPGFELSLQTFRNEYASAKDEPDLLDEFLREVCGVPEMPRAVGGLARFDVEQWKRTALTAHEVVKPGECVFAYDIHRGWSSIVVSSGTLSRSYGEVVEHRKGDGWLPTRLAELVKRWRPTAIGLDGGNGESIAALGSIREHFESDDVDIDAELLVPLTGTKYKAACSDIEFAVKNGAAFRPSGDPDQLNAAAEIAAAKVIGDSWLWDRKSARHTLSPLIAWTVARSLLSEPAPKSKVMRTRAGVRSSL